MSGEMADRLLAHSREQLPNEACALLGGDVASGHATALHLARNIASSPFRYEVHPEDLVRIILRIEAEGDGLVAIFHSHVTAPAVPSRSDVRSAHYPVVHLLASLAVPEADPTSAMRAWRLESAAAREVGLSIR